MKYNAGHVAITFSLGIETKSETKLTTKLFQGSSIFSQSECRMNAFMQKIPYMRNGSYRTVIFTLDEHDSHRPFLLNPAKSTRKQSFFL